MQKNMHKHLKEDRFVNKIVAVTGGTRGIGKNIACAFGREKAFVIICGIDEHEGRAVMSELRKHGMSVEFLGVDLRQKGAPQAMVQQIVKRWKRLDILVNNACSKRRISLLEENEDTWEEGISVTLRAAFFASQEAIRRMSKMGGGSIVNISSIAALLVCHESPVYHIAKAGLLQMTRYLAAHAGIHKVRVNAVLPGFIVKDEDRGRYLKDDNKQYRQKAEFCHPLGHVGKTDDVANAVLFLCSQKASFISGQCLSIDGGLTLQEQSSLLFRYDKKTYQNKK